MRGSPVAILGYFPHPALGRCRAAFCAGRLAGVWLGSGGNPARDLERRGFAVRRGPVPRGFLAALRGERRASRRLRAIELDLRGIPPFARRVARAIRVLGWGEVLTYAEVARLLGRPKAARAVGQALGRNPVPLVAPCHRVIAAGSRLGGFTPGVAMKRRLLASESVRLRSSF